MSFPASPSWQPDRLWWWAASGVVLVLMMPLAVTDIPPLADYPNHLARMYVLAFGAGDPFLSQVYQTHWRIIPNLGIDLIAPALLALLPLTVAGRMVLAATLLLPLLGTIAYSRAVLRQRSFWPLASGLVAYNAAFLLGFMNLLLGIGAALLAAAAWVRWREQRPLVAVAATAVLAVVVFFLHIFGILFLAVLLGSHELVALLAQWRAGRNPGRVLVPRAALAGAVFAAPAILYLLSPLAGVTGPSFADGLAWKATWLAGPFLNYSFTFDVATAAAVVIFIAASLAARRGIVAAQPAIGMAVLLLIYPLVPFATRGTAYVDMRLPIMAGFLLFAGFAPSRWPAASATAAGIGFALLLLLRMGMLAVVWQGQNHDLAQMRRIVAAIAPHSRVLAVTANRSDNLAYWQSMPRHRLISPGIRTFDHLPALVVTQAHSIWPLLFTSPSKQPLMVRPAYRDITLPEGDVPWVGWLRTDHPGPDAMEHAPYLQGWPDKFDYVLVLGAGAFGDLRQFRPDRLDLIDRTDFAALLRIRRPSL